MKIVSVPQLRASIICAGFVGALVASLAIFSSIGPHGYVIGVFGALTIPLMFAPLDIESTGGARHRFVEIMSFLMTCISAMIAFRGFAIGVQTADSIQEIATEVAFASLGCLAVFGVFGHVMWWTRENRRRFPIVPNRTFREEVAVATSAFKVFGVLIAALWSLILVPWVPGIALVSAWLTITFIGLVLISAGSKANDQQRFSTTIEWLIFLCNTLVVAAALGELIFDGSARLKAISLLSAIVSGVALVHIVVATGARFWRKGLHQT